MPSWLRNRFSRGRNNEERARIRNAVLGGQIEAASKYSPTLTDEAQRTEDYTNDRAIRNTNVDSILYDLYEQTSDPGERAFLAGLLYRVSYTNALRCVDSYTADTYKIAERGDIKRYLMDVPLRKRETGYTFLIHSILQEASKLNDDSKRGNKLKLLKNRNVTTRIGMMTPEQEKAGGGF